MSDKIKFNVCRVCFKSQSFSMLLSLFEEDKGRAEKFKIVSGIDISVDKGKRDALICLPCLNEVNNAYYLREKMINCENLYFSMGRAEFEVEYLEEDEELPTPKTQHVVVIQNDEEKLRIKRDPSVEYELEIPLKVEENSQNPRHLQLQNRIEVHDKKKLFTCCSCSKSFHYIHNLHLHMATHNFGKDSTSNPNRPFKCNVDGCEKYFKNKRGLTVHQKTHA